MESSSAYRFAGEILLDPREQKRLPQRLVCSDFRHFSGDQAGWAFCFAARATWPVQFQTKDAGFHFLSGVKPQENSSAGHYVFFQHEGISRRARIGTDPYGVCPVFFWHDSKRLLFASHVSILMRILDRQPSIDLAVLADFFRLGLTLDGDTFREGIKRLPLGHAIEIDGSNIFIRKVSDSGPLVSRYENRQRAIEEIAEAFRRAVRSLADRFRAASCHLSGGADSRLILAGLTSQQRNEHSFHTRHNTAYSESEDRDVFLARQLAGRWNLRHLVQKPERSWVNFLDHEGPIVGPTISGLHGGEFLGGQAFMQLPFNMREVRGRAAKLKLPFLRGEAAADPDSTLARLPDFKQEHERLRFIIAHFLRSDRTVIYNSTEGSWSSPAVFPHITVSPFWDGDFLSALQRVPEEWLMEYRFYADLFEKAFPEFTELPFNSMIGKTGAGCRFAEAGTDPKTTQNRDIHQQKATFDTADLQLASPYFNFDGIKEGWDQDELFGIKCLNFESYLNSH